MNKKWLLKIAGGLYLLLLIYLLFLAPFRTDTHTGLNLIPFNSHDEFAAMFRPSMFFYWLVNVPGNVIAFYPIPFIFYLFWASSARLLIAILLSLLVPISIEFTQYITKTGFANIDDVILNCSGYCAGCLHLNVIRRKKENSKQ